MSDLPTAVVAYVAALADADSAPPWARIMREDVAAARMRELLAACFGADVTLDDALVLHAPDFVREQAREWAAMAAKIAPPAPVVLGPWHTPLTSKDGGTVRYPVSIPTWPNASVVVGKAKTFVFARTDVIVFRTEQTGQEGQDAADEWMRAQGWVLLDAEPLREPVALGAWHADLIGRRFRATTSPGPLFCALAVGPEGWGVSTRPILTYPPVPSELAAHGPQTGAEGERLAMVAALALGFVEGA